MTAYKEICIQTHKHQFSLQFHANHTVNSQLQHLEMRRKAFSMLTAHVQESFIFVASFQNNLLLS